VCIREVDQLPGNLLRLGGHVHGRVQGTALEDGGQPVGAEQVAIADKGAVRSDRRTTRLGFSNSNSTPPEHDAEFE
jgi:hypothetical protein